MPQLQLLALHHKLRYSSWLAASPHQPIGGWVRLDGRVVWARHRQRSPMQSPIPQHR